MLKIFCFLLITTSLIECSNVSNSKEELRINLDISNRKNEVIGFVTVENSFKKAVTINSFTASVATLSLEIQDCNGNTFDGLGPPPMPPYNIDNFDITLKQGEDIKIPLNSIQFVVDLPRKDLKIRGKIHYKIDDKNTLRTSYSPWVMLNDIK
ncbi:hypothetical protein HNQ02_003696 [Flavobacterium sp. 7E]|uniref:hypothetical protein n=1 Tax=Flavobacterium sp. 7E TaxID=2735898 RepID=UPI00156F00F8|nr:hypothetical protein [Flavobacterium sp. 7E]NRS90749.1 hypothetical protein [Flavobacterium sp. 7E]